MRQVVLVVSLAVLAAVAGITALLAADWPCFRGTPEMTAALTATLPVKPALKWKTDTSGSIDGAVAIVGDRVYVANSDGEVLALRLSDGVQIWKKKVGSGFSGGPLVAAGTIFLGDQDGRVYAMTTANGTMMWDKAVAGDKIVGSATYYNRTVLVGGYDNKLYCLKAGTGDQAWEFEADAQVNCSPLVAEGKAVIAGCDGAVRIINADTGKEVAAANEGGKYASSPAYSNGTLFAGSLDGVYLAANMKGEVLWNMTGDDDPGECKASPAVSPGGTVVFASSANAKVWGVNRDTGKIRWTFRPKDTVESSPVIVNKIVYFGCNDGALYGVDLATGKQLWKQVLGGSVTGSPAVAGDRLIVGNSDGTVFCYGK
jgi:outer membrane protein assembly factor BamB